MNEPFAVRASSGPPTTGTVHCAATARSTDSGETWFDEHDSGQLPDPSCKNTVASFEAAALGVTTHSSSSSSSSSSSNFLVHGGAHNWQYNSRTNVSVLFSRDGGQKWGEEAMIWPAPRIGGYVAVQTWAGHDALPAPAADTGAGEKGAVGVIFENNTCSIAFARVNFTV